MGRKDELGIWGERIASEFLVAEGYRVVDQRWRCRLGEIDIVATKGQTTCFVEVKTRRSVAFGHPLEAINAKKLSRLRQLAGLWCETKQPASRKIRIDAVGIIGDGVTVYSLDHRQGVFD